MLNGLIQKMTSSFMAFFLLVLALLGINVDDKHTSKDNMVSLVTSSINEEVVLNEVVTKGDTETYKFSLKGRNINFTVTSKLELFSIMNTNVSRKVELIEINYEEAIANSLSMIIAREILAATSKIKDDPITSSDGYVIHVNNYNDIDKLADFIVKLDKTYAFKEIKPDNIKHITTGKIEFNNCTIDGIRFSTSSESRLTESYVKDQLVSKYIKQLKKLKLTDSTIPTDVWNSVK